MIGLSEKEKIQRKIKALETEVIAAAEGIKQLSGRPLTPGEEQKLKGYKAQQQDASMEIAGLTAKLEQDC